jgi:hypothetical protein
MGYIRQERDEDIVSKPYDVLINERESNEDYTNHKIYSRNKRLKLAMQSGDWYRKLSMAYALHIPWSTLYQPSKELDSETIEYIVARATDITTSSTNQYLDHYRRPQSNEKDRELDTAPTH